MSRQIVDSKIQQTTTQVMCNFCRLWYNRKPEINKRFVLTIKGNNVIICAYCVKAAKERLLIELSSENSQECV